MKPKSIKPDLKLGNITVRSLEELRRNANHHLLGEYRAKRLQRFLEARSHEDLVDEINSIEAADDLSELESLCRILGIEHAITIPYKTCNNETSTQRTEEEIINKIEERRMTARYNVVIVGQTGVGKSELINYLYGYTVAKSGVGKPVTQNGFHPIDLTINGLPVRIFDSWGIEVATYDQWIKELESELKDRGLEQSADKWFHSVYYCINAGCSRIQEADIAIIRKFQSSSYNVNIILTKADSISDEQITEFSDEIRKELGNIAVIPVCSVTRSGRGGTIHPFGKSEVETQAYCDFYSSLSKRLPERCELVIDEHIRNWATEQRFYVKSNLSWQGFNDSEVEEKIQNSLKGLISRIPEIAGMEIKNTLSMYNQFCELMNYPPQSFDELQKISFSGRSSSSSQLFREGDSAFENVAKAAFFVIAVVPIIVYGVTTNAMKKDAQTKLINGINESEKKLLSCLPQLKEGIIKNLSSLQKKAQAKTS
jgi:GTP-binding protein EngB required for normal cell division